MKKLTLILLVLAALAAAVTPSLAEIIPPYGEGQIGLQAVVLCESLSVRRQPAANAATVHTLHAGDRFSVQHVQDGWADCFVSDDVNAGLTGWVNADYIIVDPAWYRTDAATPVYAWDDTEAPKVALLEKGTLLPILKDEGEWVIVGLRGATGWILKTDADLVDPEPQW